MLESEVGIAGLMTAILKNYFQIQSPYSFGYSLGETSMMLAQGVWTSFKSTSDYLNSSPLFKTRLSGPKNAVRQHWGLPLIHEGKREEFWSNYILICSYSLVQEVLKNENRVYVVLINTPEEVIIAGETKACERVIQTLKCDAFPTSINHVIHCEPMHSEYDELVKVNTLPIQTNSKTIFYSAAEYAPMKIDSHLIGKNIAKALCHQLDFPRLVNRAYNDNVRIFIEVGVGSNCSRWISEILKDKGHLAVSLNRRGVDDHTSIIKALAKLFSHRIELDLSPLYSLPNIKFAEDTSLLDYQHKMTPIPNYQSLNKNNARMAKAHNFLLQSRQTSLQQLSLFLQQQLDLYKKMVIQAKKEQ
jgi:PfaB family protein